MPPKVKKPKQGKKKLISLDDVDTTVLTRDKLELFCVDVYEAVVKEKQYTEFLRLDRDKLSSMVAISREHLTIIRNANLEKEHELQTAEAKHRVDMWENRQKLIQLAGEKNIECLNNKLATIAKSNFEVRNHEERLSQITQDIQDLKSKNHQMDKTHRDSVIKLEILDAENRCTTRQKDKEQHLLMESKRDKIITNKTKELELVFGTEYKNFEKRKGQDIANLMRVNLKFTTDLKHYYNGIVNHNLSIMNVMKTDFIKLKEKSAGYEKLLIQLKKENQFLKEELNKSQINETKLREKLSGSQQNKCALIRLKKSLELKRTELQQHTTELDVLNMAVEKTKKVVQMMKNEEEQKTLTKMSRAQERLLTLEYIVVHLYNRAREIDSTLNQIKRVCHEKGISNPLLLEIEPFNDCSLDEMNYQIVSVAEERGRILTAFKQLLRKYYLHEDDVGFEPLRADQILKAATHLRVLVDDSDF